MRRLALQNLAPSHWATGGGHQSPPIIIVFNGVFRARATGVAGPATTSCGHLSLLPGPLGDQYFYDGRHFEGGGESEHRFHL